MVFDWDEEKARSNLAKHNVSFDEATSVFDDPLFLTFADPEHSLQAAIFPDSGAVNEGLRLLIRLIQQTSSEAGVQSVVVSKEA
ncbi:MAG: BrnT family toxin [Nostoc sp.]|uniref:BrnT family toxin n=1 Tax=Nostoc sp. TaxID=1180 RepID=UPI002FF58BAC